MQRFALLLLLGALTGLTGLVHARASSAGCAPNLHWTDIGPVWSPTGNKIAYVRIEIGCFSPRRTYVIDPEGGAPVPIRYGEDRPSWSPDGRRLAFAGNLTIANADGSGSEELRRYPSWHPTWSPDGRFIAFGGGTGQGDVYRIGSDGFGETNLTNTSGQAESNPTWSPRGDMIAFRVDSASYVAVIAPDGSGRRTVYTGRPPHSETVWSHDGTRLAFLTRPGLYSLELVVVDVVTESARVLASGNIYGDPSWSPDSSRISFNRYIPGALPIWTMRTIRVDGTDEQNLGPGADLTWSPDGSRIAFVSFGDHCPTRSGLYVGSADRATERRLTNECRIDGTQGDDLLRGSVDDDLVFALAGNDRIEAKSGADRLYAAEGNDKVYGDRAPDLISGGPGHDRLDGGMGADVILGGPGRDRISGGHGNDTIMARDGEVDRISCGSHRDRVTADRRDRVGGGCERVRRA